MCTTRQKDKNEKYSDVVQSFQGNKDSLPRNIMVVDSYAEISQGTVSVRMINIGLEDVWINQKTGVGTSHSASLIHEVSQGILRMVVVPYVSRREICDTGKVDMMQNSSSDITEDSNLSFGGWNVTIVDPNSITIQIEHQESAGDEQDVTTASINMAPPPDCDTSRRR
ncbi:unnamed protein product [Mytilus edulis]|uniref:Uncharacterized protein n=1 Tax=Mytilus edulis TaxID=6550 RepID=A0A8S3QNR1_MYTED|nr:unnamed protein product [Mytilus edulis]